jgi:hypothetical protein
VTRQLHCRKHYEREERLVRVRTSGRHFPSSGGAGRAEIDADSGKDDRKLEHQM